MIGHVDEVHGHEAGRARHLAVRAHATDVVRVGQGQHGHAGLPAALDPHGHGLAGHAPPVAALAVEHQERAVVLRHLHRAVGHDEPVLEVPDVGGHELDAVAVVPGQVRVDQVAGHQVRFRGLAAPALDDLPDQSSKTLVSDVHDTLLGSVGETRPDSTMGRAPGLRHARP